MRPTSRCRASATAGAILKYSLVGNTWNSNGSYTTTFGGFGLAAARNPARGTSLYVTTGNGATANNSLLKLTDIGGYNTTINITTANNVALYTASGGATLKGVDFAPIPVPEPGSLGLLAIGAILGCAEASSNAGQKGTWKGPDKRDIQDWGGPRMRLVPQECPNYELIAR
jgi:hypothetical protein